MKLTERDREILKFINAVGWCNASQLGRRFGMKWWIVYRVMKRLVNADLVLHEKMSFEFFGVYYLTYKGASYTDLPHIEKISKGGYDHQKALIDVILKLRDMHPEATWVSERHLKQQKFLYGVGRFGHVSDGVFIFPDEKKVSIEVELSRKSRRRLQGIINSYAGTLTYKEVWYFCEDEVMSKVAAVVGKKSFIKIFSLREFIYE